MVLTMIGGIALWLTPFAQAPQTATGQAPDAGRGRGGGDQFAGQPRIQELLTRGFKWAVGKE